MTRRASRLSSHALIRVCGRAFAAALVAIAGASALAGAPPAAPAAAARPYEHVWRIEGLYRGDAGATRRAVVSDRMTLEYRDGRWRGIVRLVDVLGIEEASGYVQSQNASMTLSLVGDTSEGGIAVAGRFTGVAQLRTREVASLDGAVKPSVAGALATYDVSGFWAARLEGEVAEGEIYFQSARRRDGSRGPVREADWFNRASLEAIDATGEPQPFVVAVEGLEAAPGGDDAAPDSGDDGPGRDDSGAGSPAARARRPGFLANVGRGLGGVKVARPVPVSGAQAAAARALRDSVPSGTTRLPADSVAVDLDVSGAYLDAKNRAAGLLGEAMEPVGAVASDGRAAVEQLYARVPGRPAPAEDEDAATFYKSRFERLLAVQADVGGAPELLAQVRGVPAGADAETIAGLRAWLAAVEAVVTPVANDASLVVAVTSASSSVSEEPVAQAGPLAAAVLAATDDAAAPEDALDVSRFERRTDLDAAWSATGTALPNRVQAANAGVAGAPAPLTWAGGSQSVQADAWLAFARSDGLVFWRAGEGGEVALADATLRGWAWRLPRAALVQAERVGRVYERYALP